MSAGAPLFVPTFLPKEGGAAKEDTVHPAPSTASLMSSPTPGGPHPSGVPGSYNVVNPGFSSPILTSTGASGNTASYSMSTPQMQMWQVHPSAASMPLVHPSYPGYPTAPAHSPMMYMPMSVMAPPYSSNSFPANSAPLTSYSSPTAKVPTPPSAPAVPAECGLQLLMPGSVLPAGVPFCPRGVPPSDAYARGARVHPSKGFLS